VVWRTHVCELTDLAYSDRHRLLDVAIGVEGVLRDLLRPVKMNVASLGNLVPHLHWHIIPRFHDDPFFPDSIWSTARRAPGGREPLSRDVLGAALEERLGGFAKTPL
jgi:diadenosine tetraphosphate (Ap4A) HIT family hydrolase